MASAALNPEIVQNSLSSLDKGTNLVPNGEPAEEGGSSITSHFNDWPNEAGWNTTYEQRTPVELKISGKIPSYAAGVLYRTGPGRRDVETKTGDIFQISHWFDGFNTVHRFDIQARSDGTKVFYNSRCTVDKLIEHVRETGSYKQISFAQKKDPCQSIFRKSMSIFRGAIDSTKPISGHHNVGVALSPNMPGMTPLKPSSHSSGIATLITRTDANVYQKLDPETLEPLGVCRQDVLHPDLTGPLSAAHAKTCPRTGDVFNYNLDLGMTGIYRVFKVSASTGETTILATVSAPAAYMHSLFITENTIILCVWNAHYSLPGISLLYHQNLMDAISPLDPSQPARWFVIDRTPARRGVIATFHTEAFMAFHTINAYEEPSPGDLSKTDIIADVITYADLSILHGLLYKNIISNSPDAAGLHADPDSPFRSTITRFRLPSIPVSTTTTLQSPNSDLPATKPRDAILIHRAPKAHNIELPTINSAYATRPYRYVYGVMDTGKSTLYDTMAKYDFQERKMTTWCRHAQTAGEPIFVADPQGTAEDDGLLLSVVLDGTAGRSYLLVLDARTMEEMGRAEIDGAVGLGFHGVHVPVGGRVFGEKNKNETLESL